MDIDLMFLEKKKKSFLLLASIINMHSNLGLI